MYTIFDMMELDVWEYINLSLPDTKLSYIESETLEKVKNFENYQ